MGTLRVVRDEGDHMLEPGSYLYSIPELHNPAVLHDPDHHISHAVPVASFSVKSSSSSFA